MAYNEVDGAPMVGGNGPDKNIGKAELRAQIWRRFILRQFARHHGTIKQVEIARILRCTPGRVTAYLGDPDLLGRKSVERIASCFKIPTQEFIFRTWRAITVRQEGPDDEPPRRPVSRRPKYAQASSGAIFDQYQEESILKDSRRALNEAYYVSMLNRRYVEAATYLADLEELPESSSDPLTQADNLHKRYRLLSSLGCVNNGVLVKVLSEAANLLATDVDTEEGRKKLSTLRIAVLSDQVSYYSERLSPNSPNDRQVLMKLHESLRSLLPSARTPATRATIYLKCAQIQAMLGNSDLAEKLLETGRKEANGTIWEYHALITEVLVLRSKGDHESAIKCAASLSSKEAVIEDEHHLQIIRLHLVEMILGIERFRKPVPDSDTGTNSSEK